MLTEILGEEGYRTDEAVNGAEAWDKLRSSEEPLVVILKYMMPVMTGLDVLRAIAEREPRLATTHAFVLTSAHLDYPVEAAKLLPGVPLPFVRMPFAIGPLLNELERAAARLTGQA